MENVIENLSKDYAKGNARVNDSEYDELEKIANIYNDEGKSAHTHQEGKIKLPKQMMSMDKLNSQKEWDKWYCPEKKYNISVKMDGISVLLYKNRAYTRGNGTMGGDVTWIKDLLKIPEPPVGIMVRGELILSKDAWLYMKEHGEQTSNPLSFISGFSNLKPVKEHKFSKLIDFVAFQYIEKNNLYEIAPSEQFKELKNLGYQIPKNKRYSGTISYDDLQDILDDFREKSIYELDGIIIRAEEEVRRVDDTNPPYSKAYKDSTLVETVVEKVKWETSRYGILKPVVIYKTFELEGRKYSKATAHHAEFIRENNVGPGAKILVGIKTVPSILEVLRPIDPEDVELPEGKWDGKELLSLEITDKQRIKTLENFFTDMGFDRFKAGRIEQLYDIGCKTVNDILTLEEKSLQNVLGPKVGKDIYDQIQIKYYKHGTDEKLFLASGFFQGLGSTLINDMFKRYTIEDVLLGRLKEFKGFGEKRVNIINENLPFFMSWFASLPKRELEDEDDKNNDDEYKGEKINVCLTGSPPEGFTKATWLKKHKELNNFDKLTKNVELLISGGNISNKVNEAKKKGIKIMTYKEYDDSKNDDSSCISEFDLELDSDSDSNEE